MDTIIFNGNQFAAEIEAKLPKNTGKKLGIWLDKSNVYVQKKIEMAQRLGVEVRLNENIRGDEDGLMVQLPHPKSKELIASIPPSKDVDGLRDDSKFMPAVVKAILSILATSPATEGEVVVVGSAGFVGRKLLHYLPNAIGMDKEDFDPSALLRADVVISCTGQAGLIKPEMVKDGVICIDVGYPKGDFDPSALLRASFFTPVPGGVGPVTVVSLFTNILGSVV